MHGWANNYGKTAYVSRGLDSVAFLTIYWQRLLLSIGPGCLIR